MPLDLRARLAALSPEKRALLEQRLRAEKADAPNNRIQHHQDLERPPLSFAQQRLWFLEQLEPGGGHYNLPLFLRFNGLVDDAKLTAAINEIIRRHDSLRTIFVLESGEPRQEILAELEVQIESVDLRPLPAALRDAESGRLTTATVMQPFDLRKGPLLRAQLQWLSDDEQLLTVTMHHIVADGWSLGVFARELATIHAALCRDEAVPLAPLPLQYADFAVWQRDFLQGERRERLLDYWTRTLAGMPARLELPTDRPRPRMQTFEGGMLVRPYPKQAIDALARLAQQHEATLFMALLAVFKLLLHRLSGVSDIVVGSPIANRGRLELEGLIGFFVNTLVLRTDLAGDPSFRDVLDRVRDVTLNAYAHQDLPFERLVEEMNPDRSLDHNPLFQVMFGMQNTEVERPGQNGQSQLGVGTSKFDLTASVSETAEGITCAFEFSSALFDPETIISLADAFEVLIESVAAFPDAPISGLPLTDETQRARLIAQAETPGPEPHAPTLSALFERQAAATPAAPAVCTAEASHSYAEIDARANRLARALRDAGAGPDTIVGLCMDRTPDLPIAMIAIGKAGAAFLPLDPSNPPERIAFMLADAGVRIVLTHSAVRSALPPAFDGVIWTLDREWPRIAAYSPAALAAAASPDDIAYVIYTSGSTGRPKGVMVPHRCAANAVQTLVEAFDLPAGTRVLQFGSLSFDVSIFDLLMVIGSGGTLCMARTEAMLPGQPLVDTLRELGINIVTLPPSALGVTPVGDLPKLHTIVCGGETLPAELVRRWTAAGHRMFNAYGPTEATIWATCHRCSGGAEPPSIGRAVSRARAHVLDGSLNPLPPGFPGELYIGGAGVARGYLGRADLTAAHYIPDPFSREPGARLYRTGDRAVMRSDGEIRFIGRADHQIKLRGYRIEFGELEATLLRHSGVAEAAAVIQRTPGGEPRIALFCSVRGDTADHAVLLRHLRTHLPDYMVPAILRIMDALPLTPSGKIDRKLLEQYSEPQFVDIEPSDLGNELEQMIARLFAEVLEVAHVGRNANFFELGGHSLLATRAITRLNEIFHVRLPLREVFEHPVVADLAIAVERARSSGDRAIPPSITKADRQAVMSSEIDGL